MPRTEAELRTVTIAGEKKPATTKPGSTKNAAKRGKSTGENDEVVQKGKDLFTWWVTK